MTVAYELQRAGRALPWLRAPARRALSALVPRMPSGLPIDERGRESAQPPAPESAYRRRRRENLERLSRIDVLVGASSRITEIYSQLGVPRERLRTVHLSAGHIAGLRARPIETPPSPVRFATLAGAQNEEKGAFVLLDAARRLAAERPDGGYVLEVHGLVDERIRDELAGLPAVRVGRPYRPEELDSILDGVHVGIVPSVWEDTYPNAGLELLAKGIPVIGNARGGIPDYTIPGRTGWLNWSCSGAELASIMAGVIAEPDEVVRLNRSIRERRDELIKPLDRHLDELDEIYADLVAGARSRRAQPPPARE
jgi:glycosyltransferase involved in cell wall biosynthesis